VSQLVIEPSGIISITGLLSLAVLTLHFIIPYIYYYITGNLWVKREWEIAPSRDHTPMVTVIVPTYNEESTISEKLDNLKSQDYPRDKLEVLVIDSASTDSTVERVREWARRNPSFPLRLIREKERRGKANALNKALRDSKGEVIVITDADALWESRDTLARAVGWLGDPLVGAVSCLKRPAASGPGGFEARYRAHYNRVRLGESKKHSTPIFHGELAAFRRECLEALGGFPTSLGADDSHTATLIAVRGRRAITPDGVYCLEKLPIDKSHYHRWRIRRAQHLIQHFSSSLRLIPRAPKGFRFILALEGYIHVFNPWLLWVGLVLLALAAYSSILFLALLLAFVAAIVVTSDLKAWVIGQVYLTIGAVRNLWSKELVWSKQEK